MIKICNNNECTGCEACATVCPVQCITMTPNKDGFCYPVIDKSKCIQCKRCIKTCPNNAVLKKGNASFFMGWHKNKDILLNSSSGGAFTAIADLVLKQNGVVYGACFMEESFTVEHIEIENADDLGKLRLSKYFQGRTNECYKKAEIALKEKGRQVLFTGTGCQIAGLYKYLGKEYANLLTVDILCHGVASKKVIDAYISSKEKKYKKKVKSFRFRLKPPDSYWMHGGGTRMRLDFADGSKIIEEVGSDTFFIGFNTFLFLRESCYTCKYTGTERIADITLADFWGIDLNSLPDEQRKNGVSLIIANSEKGKALVKELNKDMIIHPADPERAVPANQALSKPGTANENRTEFFKMLDSYDFDTLVQKFNRTLYLKLKIRKILGNRLCNLIKSIVGRT